MSALDKTGLEPCPFCGGEASLRNGGPGCFFVQCDMCNATSDDRVQDTAIKAWNSRATSTSAGVTEEQPFAWTSRAGMKAIEAGREAFMFPASGDTAHLIPLYTTVTEVVEALRKPGMMVFLDGRNEHGSHVIPSLPMNMEIDGCEGDMPEFAEEIIRAAEALGFAVGEHVWTEWLWHQPQIGDEGRVELDGYWEFVRVNPVVSRALALEASRVAPVSQKEAVEPFGYWCETKGADPAFLRKPSYIPEPNHIHRVTPLYASPAPAVEPVGIKALEWRDLSYKALDMVASHPFGGEYHVTEEREHEWPFVVRPFLTSQSNYQTFDEAKAACEADYERRIRSALHPTPTPAGIGRIQSSLHPSFSRSGIEPCGGCGQSDPSKRCLGCLHSFPFTPTPVSAPAGDLERKAKAFDACDWYWPEDDTSSDACADNPFAVLGNCDALDGEVVAVSRGGVVETRFYASLPPSDDSDSDDTFDVDEPTQEAAEAKITAERDRRALRSPAVGGK